VEALLLESPWLAAARDGPGISALQTRLYYRQSMFTSLLLAQGVVLDGFEAACVGDLDRLQALVAEDPLWVSAVSADGFTCLHFAAFFARPVVVRWLLERGARVTAVSDNAMRVQPLHSAVATGDLEVVEALLQKGADPNAAQAEGYTPLDAAHAAHNPAMEKLLRQFGATAQAPLPPMKAE
jgi:ankyrin repeat protein